MKTFLFYFAYFFLYSVIGWIFETCFVMLKSKDKKFVDRGFLVGPYCPIYGCGALIMIFYLTQYKDNALTVFILSLVICSILEYVTSYIMEKLFKTRWWDYSNYKFNLNGRICGQNSLLFGLGGIIVIYIAHPVMIKLLNRIPTNIFCAISAFVLVLFIADFILSMNVINSFKKTLTSIDLKKDSTLEFAKAVREKIISNHTILQKRLLDAFPDIIVDKLLDIKNDIKEELKEFIDKYDDKND